MLSRAFVSLIALLPSVINAVTIVGPSTDRYWVFGTSNQITWNYGVGDPTTVSITVTSQNAGVLNGVFNIAEYVSISDGSYTVTDVTLKPDTGYIVNFVNPSNGSDIYASSSTFEVKAAGTAPYGATVYTVLSFSLVGTSTETFTIVETSLPPVATPSITGTVASSIASVSSTSALVAATATLHKSTSAAPASLISLAGPVVAALSVVVASAAFIQNVL